MIAVWILTGTGRLAFGGAVISSRVIWALSEDGGLPMACQALTGSGGPVTTGVSSAAAPFAPGAVIELVVGMAERFQRQRDDRGRDARAAGGDDRLRKVDAGVLDRLLEFRQRLEAALIGEDAGWQAARAGHVAGAHTGARLRLGGRKTAGAAGIGDLQCAPLATMSRIVLETDDAARRHRSA